MKFCGRGFPRNLSPCTKNIRKNTKPTFIPYTLQMMQGVFAQRCSSLLKHYIANLIPALMQCGKAGLMAQLCVNASSLQTEESDHNQSQSSMSIHPYLPDGSGYWPLHKSPGTTILFFLKWDHNCWAAWFVNCTDQCHWSPLTLIESHVTDLPPYIYPMERRGCIFTKSFAPGTTWALTVQMFLEIEGVWDVNTLRKRGVLMGGQPFTHLNLLASPFLPILVYLSSRDVIELNKASCYWRAAAAAAVCGTGRRGAILECCYICF